VAPASCLPPALRGRQDARTTGRRAFRPQPKVHDSLLAPFRTDPNGTKICAIWERIL